MGNIRDFTHLCVAVHPWKFNINILMKLETYTNVKVFLNGKTIIYYSKENKQACALSNWNNSILEGRNVRPGRFNHSGLNMTFFSFFLG